MDDNEPVLAELKKISAWADVQRRITKWSLVAVAVFVPALLIGGIVLENRLNAHVEDVTRQGETEQPSWSDVDWNVRRADLDKAIRIGEELIQKMPQYA